MAISKRNYVPGDFEAISGETFGTVVVSSWEYFVLDSYFKFELADIVIRIDSVSGDILVAGTDYELKRDEYFTSFEQDYTGKNLYGQVRFLNPALAGRVAFVSGNNFGTMVDNEQFKKYVDDNVGQVNLKRNIIKGLVDPYLVDDPSFDNATRTMTLSHSSGTFNFFSDAKEFSIPNGDSRLQVVIPDLTQFYYLYFDTNGQLTYETAVNISTIRRFNLGPFVYWDTDEDAGTGAEIIIVNRWEAAQANEVENEASYSTKGIQVQTAVIMEGTLSGSTVGHSGGTYYSNRDYNFSFSPITAGSKIWARFYLEGKDVSTLDRIKRSINLSGIPYITDVDLGIGATGRLVYNNFNPALGVDGEFEVLTAPNNDYVACHFGVAHGLVFVTSLLGQAVYNSASDARAGLSAERDALIVNPTAFKDIGVVASCIFTSTGALIYADTTTLELFDYPIGGVTVSVPGGTAATLQSTYNNSVQPQITTSDSKGALQFRDGRTAALPRNIIEYLDDNGDILSASSTEGFKTHEKLGIWDSTFTNEIGYAHENADGDIEIFAGNSNDVHLESDTGIVSCSNLNTDYSGAASDLIITKDILTNQNTIENTLINGSDANGEGLENLGNTSIGGAGNDGLLNVGTLDPTTTDWIPTNKDLLIVSADAQATIVSTAGGTWGSALGFTQLDSGTGDFENTWTVIRKTNEGGSGDGSFNFTYGTNKDGFLNAIKATFHTDGNAGISGDTFNIATSKTPSSATATGTTGDKAWDSNYEYRCVATNTWKRSALSTWT